MTNLQSTFGTPRYTLLDQIGAGAMGSVYRAIDRITGQPVALKRLSMAPEERALASYRPPDDPQALLLTLAHEFRTLASLRHPHIISVLDYGFDADRQPFFTMELLEGAQTVLDAAQGLPRAGQVALLLQALEALSYLHRRGVLHHDLKSANILVAQGRVRLLDFGLAVLTSQERPDDAFGTLQYLAPEVLDGCPYTEAADLYSLGVIAYEMLTGRHPFPAEVLDDYLERLFDTAPDLEPLAADLELAAVIDTLLAKQPEQRYPDAEATIAALRAALALPARSEERAIRESFLQAATFVGRETELGRLTAALEAALAGQMSAWLVGGESGVGKSRLLDELRTRALVEGALVLRGQAVESGGLPYQLWREPLRRLALSVELSVLEAGVLREIVPDIGALLGRPIAEAPRLPGQAGRQRLVLTIADLFGRCAQPILLLLEDLQWMGDGLDLLKVLLSRGSASPLLIVGSYRDDERPDLPTLLPGMRHLPLARLDVKAINALSDAMLGPAGRQPQVVDLLARESEGNTFFMIEVVRALAETLGSLDQLGQATLPASVFAGGVRQVLRRRLGRVPAELRGLLELAAINGRQLDLALLAHLAPDIPLEHWLDTCAAVAVLEVVDATWRFAHDKLRETLLADLPVGTRPQLHHQIAEALEAIYPGQEIYAEALAEHWEAAGEHKRALRYLLQVVERLVLVTGEYARAEELIARGLAYTPADQQARMQWLAGTAAMRLGSYGDAVSRFERCLTAEGAGVNDRVAALNGLSRACWEQGNDAQAQAYARSALDEARTIDDLELVGQSLQYLGAAAERLGDHAAARAAFVESLECRRRLGDRTTIASSLNDLGTLAWYQAEYDTARAYFEESLQIIRAIDHRLGIVIILGNLGLIRYEQGEYAAGYAALEESLARARALKNPFQIAWGLNNLGSLSFAQGNLAKAHACFEEGLHIQRTIGDHVGSIDNMLGLGHVALAHGDHVAAHAHYEQSLLTARELNAPWPTAVSLSGLGDLAAAQGQHSLARAYYAESLALAQTNGYRQILAATQADLALVLLQIGEHGTARTAFAAALSVARDLATRPRLAHVLLVAATLAHGEGRTAAAAVYLGLAQAQEVLDPRYGQALAQLSAALEARLGAAGCAAAITHGQGLTLDSVIADLR